MLDKEEMARRVRFAFKNVPRGAAARIAVELDITPQAVSGWQRTGKVDKANIPTLARHTGRRVEYFLDSTVQDDDSATQPSPANDPEWADVLAYKQAIGLGNEREAEEYVQTHKIKFRRESLSKHNLSPSDLGTMRGDGDSMFPTIKHDDLVLFDKSDVRPRHRKVYALKVPGAAKDAYNVKRCKISKGVVSFIADNPNGDHGWIERQLGDPNFPIEIIGRVRWVAGWVD